LEQKCRKQGYNSGITDFIVMRTHFRALSRKVNKLYKYADDTTWLLPEHTDFSLEGEFVVLKQWSESNTMILNLLKTKEFVFHRSNHSLYISSVPLSDIERVKSVKLLESTCQICYASMNILNMY